MSDFIGITKDVKHSILNKNIAHFKKCILENHKLLCKIGVVSEKAGSFIQHVAKLGGVAKVCGAGSVLGDGVGAIFVICDADITDLVNKYGYKVINVKTAINGVSAC